MYVEHGEAHAAFREQLRAFMAACNGLDDNELLVASRCHGWSVGDVLVHVHLGLQDMLLGIVSPTDAAPDTDAASYWRQQVPTNDPGADRVAGVRFVRLLGAAYRRPTGVVGHLRPTTEGIARAVSALSAGSLRFQGCVLTTGDFLTTWAVELAIHHLDLARDLELTAPSPIALRLARQTIEALAYSKFPDDWPDDVAVLLGAGRLSPSEQQASQAGAMIDRLPALG